MITGDTPQHYTILRSSNSLCRDKAHIASTRSNFSKLLTRNFINVFSLHDNSTIVSTDSYTTKSHHLINVHQRRHSVEAFLITGSHKADIAAMIEIQKMKNETEASSTSSRPENWTPKTLTYITKLCGDCVRERCESPALLVRKRSSFQMAMARSVQNVETPPHESASWAFQRERGNGLTGRILRVANSWIATQSPLPFQKTGCIAWVSHRVSNQYHTSISPASELYPTSITTVLSRYQSKSRKRERLEGMRKRRVGREALVRDSDSSGSFSLVYICTWDDSWILPRLHHCSLPPSQFSYLFEFMLKHYHCIASLVGKELSVEIT